MDDARRTLPDIDSLWTYPDPVASEAAFRAIVPSARLAGDHDYLAQLLTQIARSQILQRRFDDGHATLDEVRAILSDRTPIARVRYLLERGRAWNDVGRAAEAAKIFEEAFELAIAVRSDLFAVDAAHMLGVMPPFEAAIRWNERAVAIAAESAEPRARRWGGTLYMNMGVNHQRLTQYPQSQRAFASAIGAFERDGNDGRRRLAELCMAKSRRLMGDAGGALSVNRKLLEQMQVAGEPIGYALEEVAECLLAIGDRDAAIPFFAQAYAVLSTDPWFPPNEVSRLERLWVLGQSAPM